HELGGNASRVIDRIRDAPARITLIALVLVILLVIATKAFTGRGTPLRGGLPSGHAAIAFAGWMAVTYIVGDHNRFLISTILLIMARRAAQPGGGAAPLPPLGVLSGGALGPLPPLFFSRAFSCPPASSRGGRSRSGGGPTRRTRTSTWAPFFGCVTA